LRLKATRITGHHFLEVVNNNIPYGIFMNISMYKGYLPSSPITAMLDARLVTSGKNLQKLLWTFSIITLLHSLSKKESALATCYRFSCYYIDIFINMPYGILLFTTSKKWWPVMRVAFNLKNIEAYFHILVQNYHEIILDAIWLYILFSICLINIS
jgi:hypothetical protein